MKKNNLKGLLSLIIIFLIIILFARVTNCYYEDKLISSLNSKNAVCTKATFKIKSNSRSSNNLMIRHFGHYDDTCSNFSLCSEFLNSSRIPAKLDNTTFFVIYDKEEKEVALPVWTKKSYDVLKKYFPDSAKLVDTSLFE